MPSLWERVYDKMRLLKFRQWNSSAKAFHYWGYVDNDNTFTSPIHGNSQQFTGLLDKQGKEIYEGDIILDKFEHKVSVEFDPDNGGWRLCHAMFASGSKIISWGLDGCKVIGNIYEHKET